MQRLADLADQFTAEHPGWNVEFDLLPEGELRQRVTTDVATTAGQFGAAQGVNIEVRPTGRYDVISVGSYEARLWAAKDWLSPMQDVVANPEDIFPTVREALTFEDAMYAAPFYGESSLTMYRADLFEDAGLEMPEQPTWDLILSAASELHDPDGGVMGMCQRAKAGWGENVALVTSMANSYGGRWFDMDWVPQLDTEPWNQAVSMYAELAKYADPDSVEDGYNENLERFRDGKCAIWVDATAAGSSLVADDSAVKDSVGFALAPGTGLSKNSDWLWVWSLAVPTTAANAELAQEFVAWATSEDYKELVAKEYGWGAIPPGTRQSLYENEEYLAAAPYAELTERSIREANPTEPTVEPVPYVGIQYVDVAEFQSVGSATGNQIAQILTGKVTVDEALKNSQWMTEQMSGQIRFMQEENR